MPRRPSRHAVGRCRLCSRTSADDARCRGCHRPLGVRTIVSLNPIMVDGTGMCGGCRVTVDGVMRFACVDGPEFDGHGVDFDELSDRLSTYGEERAPRATSAGGRDEWRAALEARSACHRPSGDAHRDARAVGNVRRGQPRVHRAPRDARGATLPGVQAGDVRRGLPGDGRHPHVHQAHRGRRPRRGGKRALR